MANIINPNEYQFPLLIDTALKWRVVKAGLHKQGYRWTSYYVECNIMEHKVMHDLPFVVLRPVPASKTLAYSGDVEYWLNKAKYGFVR